jgi:hypothetical protein
MSDAVFRKFKKEYPQFKDLTRKEYSDIIKEFNLKIVEEAVSNRDGVSFPKKLGLVLVAACPTRPKKNIDYNKSAELGIKVYHRNWDTDNKLAKICYMPGKKRTGFVNSRFWMFKPCRSFKKSVSSSFKENYVRYRKLEGTNKVSKILNSRE